MDFLMKKGDLKPYLRVTFKDGIGDPISLAGATVVFSARMRGAAALKVDARSCVVIDAAAGVVEYQWQSGDTDTEGVILCEFRRTDGGQQSAPSSGYLEGKIEANV